MPTLPIVPDLDVLENSRSCFVSRREDTVIEFALERAKDTLDAAVIPTVAIATHALFHAVPFVEACDGNGSVLHAAIKVGKSPSVDRPRSTAICRASRSILDSMR